MNNSCKVRLAWLTLCLTGAVAFGVRGSAIAVGEEPERGLAAHWRLAGNGKDDVSGRESARKVGDVELLVPEPGAAIRGSGSWLEVAADQAPRLGRGEFSLAAWVNCSEASDRLTGDVVSQYDPQSRRGFHWTIKSAPGVTSNQANWRHLQFGIDDGQESDWRDCGRPGQALLVFALAAHHGALYAGTCEPGQQQSGRVYRYEPDSSWVDCGAPDRANSVTSLIVFQGQLYAGTGKYRVAGSALPESENATLGGHVFRYDGDARWIDCGQLPETEAVGGLVEFRGQLYASSLYHPAGFFRRETDATWTRLATPRGPNAQGEVVDKRVQSLTVHEGFLYASSYDGGHVYRFDGEAWTDCGGLAENTQTYSFAQYDGRLYVGTWPSGRVYRFEDVGQWTDTGRLGNEMEVMGMLVHNGRLLAGTLPLAEVYTLDGGQAWRRLTQLDVTPDVKYRRAWTMAEHGGEVFCGTLPSGKVFAFRAGRQVIWEQPFPTGWRHVAAVRSTQRLLLYVDGQQVAQSAPWEADAYDLNSSAPWRIGAGMNGSLNGQLTDLRVYQRALTAAEVQTLATAPPR